MREHWDIIIVGARCAGATLATLLARHGVRTLVLEASARGTNLPMSTHLIQAPGIAVLDRLGLGGRVRACTPTSERSRYALDDVAVLSRAAPGRGPYCIRRATLDPWLQDTADQAGAELRFRHRVIELIREGERVVGVVAQTPQGKAQLHADLVVGADGMHSTIAQLTDAPEYLADDSTRSGYFAYYEAPESWPFEWDFTLEHTGCDLRYVFRCDGGRVLLAYVGPQQEVAAWGASHRERFEAKLLASPSTRLLATGKRPLGPVIGIPQARFFYRKPIGPGYALIGDAGHFKDIVTGNGMADAFLDAERMAHAILDGRPSALLRYWRARDVETMPLHFDAVRQGAVGFNEPFLRAVFACMSEKRALSDRLMSMLDRTLDPAALVPASVLLRGVARGLVQGPGFGTRLAVLRGLVAAARAANSDRLELRERSRLLQAARTQLEHEAPAAQLGRASNVQLTEEVA